MMKKLNDLTHSAPVSLTPSISNAVAVLKNECMLCCASFSHAEGVVKVHISAPHGVLSAHIDLNNVSEMTALCRIDSIVETLREGYRL